MRKVTFPDLVRPVVLGSLLVVPYLICLSFLFCTSTKKWISGSVIIFPAGVIGMLVVLLVCSRTIPACSFYVSKFT